MKHLNSGYKIQASVEFKQSLNKLRRFLRRKYGSEFCSQQVALIKTEITTTLTTNPYIAPVSERLLDLGIQEYRQWSVDQHNILFFRVDEDNKQVELLAVMDSRQCIEKLLYEIMLLS
jgi:plasmid stabilization system protein ParE